MDVDGTLTDGKVYYYSDGSEGKAFDIKDGYGICNILIPSGVIPIVITGRNSRMVDIRMKELGVSHVFQGQVDKLASAKSVIEDFSDCAFIGDDLNDLSLMNEVHKAGGIIGCPSDAAKEVKQIADYISNKNGGDGAVRDFIEWLIL